MAEIGFHCSHEMFAPSGLLRDVKCAERVGSLLDTISGHPERLIDTFGEHVVPIIAEG